MDWTLIVTAILAIFTVVFAIYWKKGKAIIKEVAELITVLAQTIEDDKLTPEEWVRLKKEFADVLAIFKVK